MSNAAQQVLVVDDEPEVCTFFRRLLSRNGYDVTTALNQIEAEEALERGAFSAALVDLKLPDTDGITLLRLIKARQPDCEVILMTGYSTVRTAVQAVRLGAYEYLEKPFDDIGEIEALVAKASARRNARVRRPAPRRNGPRWRARWAFRSAARRSCGGWPLSPTRSPIRRSTY
ncbi:response regulator [Alkalilimnicola ehrlichii]|uniref:response regulator n=1 Tax=Alkalilimnicola ehrlichii TaxID=351052 RepID=UPI001C6E8BB1|nr:response regulator [Alkalilimnicola ehrlichii]